MLVGAATVALGAGVVGVGASWGHVTSVADNRLTATVAEPHDAPLTIQVGATDAEGHVIPGQWQDADDEGGVAVNLPGAAALFPGSRATSVEIPVRNDSAGVDSALTLTLRQLPDVPVEPGTSDASYLASLRFSVQQPSTSLGTEAIPGGQDLTFEALQALELNALAADEESALTLSVRLASVSEIDGATWADDDLSGMRAFVQAVLEGTSL